MTAPPIYFPTKRASLARDERAAKRARPRKAREKKSMTCAEEFRSLTQYRILSKRPRGARVQTKVYVSRKRALDYARWILDAEHPLGRPRSVRIEARRVYVAAWWAVRS